MRVFNTGIILLLLFTTRLHSEPDIGPFLEPEAPFLSSALVIKDWEKSNLVRRSIIVPFVKGRWACFAGVLTGQQLADLLAYLRTLR